MQKLVLADNLMVRALRGEKTATCRRGFRDILPGQLELSAANNITSRFSVRCTSVRLTTFDQITEDEAAAEGHTPDSLYEAMLEFYPDMERNEPVTYIEWTLE